MPIYGDEWDVLILALIVRTLYSGYKVLLLLVSMQNYILFAVLVYHISSCSNVDSCLLLVSVPGDPIYGARISPFENVAGRKTQWATEEIYVPDYLRSCVAGVFVAQAF